MNMFPNILVVDDRVENLIAMEALLEDCNATILQASSGNEALTLMLKKDFSLILLDVQMPGMDGFEVAELMRANKRTKYIPIIFITAIDKDERNIFKGYEAGAVDFLSKPIEPLILKGKVEIFLNLWSQNCALAQALEEKEELSDKLKHQAQFDSLTKLPNRFLFRDRLQQSLLMSQRSGEPGALMFIDLDKFKVVNDKFGHDFGDKLLILVAACLLGCVRETDTVARIGGDEFTVILPKLSSPSVAEIIANKIIKSLANPFEIDGHIINIGGSIGATIFPNDDLNLDKLLKNADTAMYQVKETGRNGFVFFCPEMNNTALNKALFEEDFKASLDAGNFVLHYQPKVDIISGEIIGAEALVRWIKPETNTIVPPDKFIPLAEETKLIVTLGEWVVNEACKQAQEWNNDGISAIKMSVNISPIQFDDRISLTQMVKGALLKSGLSPRNLEIELTESTVMKKIDLGQKILEEFREMGIDISIDDFGTGYSSLASLKHFPIQTLKIDKSFIDDVTNNKDDYAIVSAIISMATKLSLSVIAEGVETKEQLNLLRELGCNEVQGYYFSKPVEAHEFKKMLLEQKKLDN